MGVWGHRDTWGTGTWGYGVTGMYGAWGQGVCGAQRCGVMGIWGSYGHTVTHTRVPPPTPEAFGEAPGILFISFQLQNPFLALRNSPEFFLSFFLIIIITLFSFSHPEMWEGWGGSESHPSPLPHSSCQHLEVTQQMGTAFTPPLINYFIIIINLETGRGRLG